MNNVLCREWVSDVVDFGAEGSVEFVLYTYISSRINLWRISSDFYSKFRGGGG